MNKVYVDGVAQSEFGIDDRALPELLADVGREALNNSECKEKPDKIYVGNFNMEGYQDQASLDVIVANRLGVSTTIPVRRIERGSASGALAVEIGFEDTQRYREKVLVISGEKMRSEDKDRIKITLETSKVIDEKERGLGLTMPIIAAIATTEYMIRYGIPEGKVREKFFQILNKNRKYGNENKYTYQKFREQVPRGIYFDLEKNPFIARPLSRFDCAGTYNGAASVYLVPNETDIKLSGIRSAFSNIEIEGRRTLTSHDATIDATRAVLKDTNLNPHEFDIMELHEAFQTVPMLAAEDIGFVKRGKGFDFVLKEKNKDGKKVFYNRSGGFLCKTHPIAASGTAQLVELVMQMRGANQYSEMLGKHQKDINYGLWFSMHGFGFYNSVGIVEKTTTTVKRESLSEKNLPNHFEPRIGVLDRYADRHIGAKLVGMTTTSSGSDIDYSVIGVIRTPEGELKLGNMEDINKLKLGSRVNVVKREEGYFHFIPVSSPVSQILSKIFR